AAKTTKRSESPPRSVVPRPPPLDTPAQRFRVRRAEIHRIELGELVDALHRELDSPAGRARARASLAAMLLVLPIDQLAECADQQIVRGEIDARFHCVEHPRLASVSQFVELRIIGELIQ